EEFGPDLNSAMRDGEWIGGFDVEQAMLKVGKLAAEAKWAKAMAQLAAGHDLALTVIRRKPYVVARKANEAKIKATTKLRGIPSTKKGESYGEIVETRWDAAQALAKEKNFDGATRAINELAEYIRTTVEANPSVSEGRAKVENDGPVIEAA